MRYTIIYRLAHPEYLPAVSVAMVNAYTHHELDEKIAKLKMKWEGRGYHVQIKKVMAKSKV